jgi:hypothetical protein
MAVKAIGFHVSKDGKWTQEEIWATAVPGKTIFSGDTVVIDKFITLNTDITVEGTLIATEQGSILGNKAITVSDSGLLINKGSFIVKEVTNNGTIINHLIFECTRDLINDGVIKNYETVLVGSQIQNFGYMEGDGRQFFSNKEMINRAEGVLSGNIDICSGVDLSNNGTLDSTKISICGHNMIRKTTLMAYTNEDRIDLQLYNPKDVETSHIRIERSGNGKDFYIIDAIGYEQMVEMGSDIIYVYGDEFLFDESYIFYCVTVVDSEGELSELPVIGVSKPRRPVEEFASAE